MNDPTMLFYLLPFVGVLGLFMAAILLLMVIGGIIDAWRRRGRRS